MSQRDVVDAVVFVALGTFIATFALLLVSRAIPDRRLRWFDGRSTLAARDPVFATWTLVGIGAAIWGGTGLQHHTSTWLAILLAIGPTFVLRALIVVAHNRRLASEVEHTPRP